MNQWIKRGKIIKKAREDKGLKQEDLANILKKSISTVSGYESGKKKIDFDNLKKLCTVLDLSLLEL